MAYLQRTITLMFDGTGVLDVLKNEETGEPRKLPNLGDGLFVTVRNPMLMPQSLLSPKKDIAVGPDGRPLDVEAALEAGAEVVAGLIVDWNLPDVMDEADEPAILPLPATVTMIRNQLPTVVGDTIAELIAKARTPR